MVVACASAPGKVILFGEHAVVYGVPAVAAALSDLRIFVAVQTTSTLALQVRMPDLPTPIDLEIESQLLTELEALQQPPTPACAALISDVIHQSRRQRGESPLDELSLAALVPLLYLIHELVGDHVIASGLEIEVRSKDLPVGAGLGSSAAFGVAAAAALVRLSSTDPARTGRPPPQDLKRIDQFAFYSEILLHGTPSGIDNAVSAGGGAILFCKTNGQTSMQPISTLPHLSLLLVYTKVPRSTRALVAGVRDLYNRFQPAVDAMITAMGALAQQFVETLPTLTGEDLLTMVRMNQLLLRAVGVSHASLDAIGETVDRVAGGAAAAKLTGAGGGGCAIVLLRPGLSLQEETEVRRRLTSALSRWTWRWGRFTVFSSSVGGEGVLWLDREEFPTRFSPGTTRPRALWVMAGVSVAVVALWAMRRSKR